jgi:two-component system CheB/CheR fusion protein
VDGDTFELGWREKHGPAVEQPLTSGFGLALLQGEIAYRLGGHVETTFHQEGLRVQISFPLHHKETS